jgi:hypothetical protein
MTMLPIFMCMMGCGLQMTVAVDASATPAARAQTHFVIVAENPAVAPDNLLFLQWAGEVSRALTSQGFQKVDSADAADMVVRMDWDVGPPKTITRHGTTAQLQNAGNVQMAPAGKGGAPAGEHNKAGFDWIQTPANWQVTTYVRSLSLKAVDRQGRALWQVAARSEGPEDDVGPVVPTLAAAAAPFFASNAGASRHMIGDQETLVKYVRGDIPSLASKK